MEIIKPHHKASEKVSRKNLSFALKEAKEMINFIDENNSKGFSGHWKHAVALSHCQVSENPIKMFVVARDLIKPVEISRNANYINYYFKDRIIFNARIIEARDEIQKVVPKRELKPIPNSKEFTVAVSIETKMISNLIKVNDGCMSYPYRSEKKTNRYYKIKVKYQVLRSFLGFKYLKTITEDVEAYKAHVFQHEVDHSFGIDIIHGNGTDKDVAKPYKNICLNTK